MREFRKHLGCAIAILIAAAPIAACGTTTTSEANSGILGPSMRAPGAVADGIGDVEMGGQIGATTTGTAADSATGSANSTSAFAPPTGTSRLPSASLSRAKWKVGVIIPKGNESAVPGAAKFAVDPDKAKRMISALVAEVNARGGFGGHQVTAVVVEQDYTDTTSTAQTPIQNEICTKLSEDEHVFVVLALASTTYANECYVNHRLPVLQQQPRYDDISYRAGMPWLLPPLWLTTSRMARLLPTALAGSRALSKKMGLIGLDYPYLRRPAEQFLVPGIAALGGKVVDQVWFTSNWDAVGSGISNAILRFRTQGVDRVVMWAPGGGAWILFATAAESQNYRPAYAVSSYDSPGLSADLLPAEQLPGTAGAGFFMTLDVTQSMQPTPNARERECWRVIASRAGDRYTVHGTDANTALSVCDSFWLIKAAADRYGPTMTQGSVFEGLLGLGSSFVPAELPAARFDRSTADGVSQYARVGYVAACKCIRYTSGWLLIP